MRRPGCPPRGRPTRATVTPRPRGGPLQLQPVGHLAQRAGQLGGHPGRRHPRFGEGAEHPQGPGPPVGLEVDAGDQLAVEQEREHVVAVLPLRLGHVDLDAVAEPEDPLGAGPLPDQRVERAEQRPPGHPPRHRRARSPVGRVPPAAHVDPLQLAGLDQLGDRPPAVLGTQPVVVAQVRLGRHAQGPGRPQDQPARRLVLRRRRAGQHVGGQHPLGQVVEPLEVPAGAGGERPDAEQVLADPFHVRALPPGRPGWSTAHRTAEHRLQLAGPDRPELLDRGQHVVDQAGMALHQHRIVPPPALALGRGAQQRPVPHRQQAGLVRPVLDQQPGPPGGVRPGRVVDQRPIVAAEPAEQRHVVRAHRDVDRVELQQPDPVQRAHQVPAGDRAGRVGRAEPLRGEGRAAGGGGTEDVDGRRTAHVGDGASHPRQCAAVDRPPQPARAGRSARTTSSTETSTTTPPTSCTAENRSPTTSTPSTTASTGLT